MEKSSKKQKLVEPIILTEQERKDGTIITNGIIDLSNEMMKNNLCGFSVTTDNGWKVTFKNRRLAKQMDVPMP